MSDEKEQIHYITLFHILPPVVVALLGGLLGLLVSWIVNVNACLCLAIGGYSSVLLLFAAFSRLESRQARLRGEPPPPPLTWPQIKFAVWLYFWPATLALFSVAIWPLTRELEKIRERREQQDPPKSAEFDPSKGLSVEPTTPNGAHGPGVVTSRCRRM
jgi:hypothetical protein